MEQHRRWAGIVAGVIALAGAASAGGEECATCHREIWRSYQRTGMARAFFRPTPENTVEDYSNTNTYYHQASDSYFTMARRDGKYFQGRYQIDAEGRRVNEIEKQVDYVLGSGNHARSYVSKTSGGKLVELPLAWYAEKGGYWGMNPGYDRPDHEGFRREISYDCMFCHNAYPKIPPGHERPFAEPVYEGALPEGIDCGRCHGPGARHMEAARKAGAKREDVRAAIVNPARLSGERQMEACMQCHLETTSFPLPNSIQRYERGPFSYRPEEPLADFLLTFDHAAGKGRDDKFEIVNSAYRLRKSACFLKSKGGLRCTTCHNPHDVPRGEEAAAHYTAVCRQCHAGAIARLVAEGKHTRQEGCADCHMPKRRTEDVVHVAMTDHYIQRRKPAGDLLAETAERHETDATAYRGEVAPYYPARLAETPENALYLALAQVIQKSNLGAGIERLAAAIEKYRPKQAEFYLEMAEAYRNGGQEGKALAFYEEAARRDPKSVYGLRLLGVELRRSGKLAESAATLNRAAAVAADDAKTWRELGLTYQALGKTQEAAASLGKALALDPDMAEARNNLGAIRAAGGDAAGAGAAFREAIRLEPGYADAHGNLGNLLAGSGDLAGARRELETAARIRPEDARTRYDYAMVLGRTRDFDGAQRELEATVKADPRFGEAHLVLGNLLAARGDVEGAVEHLRKAAADGDGDAKVREEAGKALRALGR